MAEIEYVLLINRYLFLPPSELELQRELYFKLKRLLMEILRNHVFHLNIKHCPINACLIVYM